MTDAVNIALQVNGQQCDLMIDIRATLLDVLREQLMLTGAKEACNRGECGTCTVLVDGRRVYSCMALAVMHAGAAVTTIEGVTQDETASQLQQAFLRHDALQCGYCTPGQILSAMGLLSEGRTGSRTEIREFMSGNLCRCGAYPQIVDAIRDVIGEP